jgi:hypothetical protein
MPIRNFAGVEVFEAEPLAGRALPRLTYDALVASARRWPEAKALPFFLMADTYDRAFTWTFPKLRARLPRGRQGRACVARSGQPRPSGASGASLQCGWRCTEPHRPGRTLLGGKCW